MSDDRLPFEDLNKKYSVAVFIRDGIADEVVAAFEDAFAKGRDGYDTWTVYPTRSHSGKPIAELLDLSKASFTSTTNPFYPYFFVILDKRTAQDKSVLLVQRDPQFPGEYDQPPYWDLRLTPKSLAVFLNVANIGHTTIESVINNEGYAEEDVKDAYIYDVPFDHTEDLNQKSVRVPLKEFERSANGEFTTLSLPAAKVEAHGLHAVAVELVWFGEPLESILLLSATPENSANEVHVVGEKV